MIQTFPGTGREECSIRCDKEMKACGYYRLSREDGDKAESDSIKNQKVLVEDYAAAKGFSLVNEYADDGFTGTNFNRPSFNRLMEDVQAGKVNCIIVKDLSRLGRNYIEMGRYMTRIFPSMGVRLIAINDGYDSIDDENASNQIIVPFKNLINDAYCRDMSMKIRSQLDLKRRMGKFIGSFSTYGYEKDPEDHNHLIIDETAAKVVELIFNMKLDGFGSLAIAKKLNEMKVPTPLEYKRICGLNYACGFRSSQDAAWSVTAINRILRNEIYAGIMIQGKRRKINYKVRQVVSVGREEWIRVENTHEAIVPKELFDVVQTLMKMDTRTPQRGEGVHVLSGILKCGTCGQNMIRRVSESRGKKYHYYHCSTYKHSKACTSHLISEAGLLENVLAAVQVTLGLLAKAEGVLRELENVPNDVIGIRLLEGQIEAQTREINRYNDLKVKLYVDMTDGVISRDEYREINSSFTSKIDSLRFALTENEKRKEKKLALNVRDVPWIREFLAFRNMTKLDRRMAVTLLESVTVDSGDVIRIRFHHAEEMEEIIAVANSAREVTA